MARMLNYVSDKELLDVLLMGYSVGELRTIATNSYRKHGYTKQAKRLRMAATLIDGVFLWRVDQIESHARLNFERRCKHTELKLHNHDTQRFVVPTENIRKPITIDLDDAENICELGIEYCRSCTHTGQAILDCKYRKSFLNIGVPVWEDTKEGECPYKWPIGEIK